MIYSSKREPFYWLTPDSETFLKRGYLLEGVTPQERIKQIAQYAEQKYIEAGAGHLFKWEVFYDYMSKGYYSLSSPIWANFGLERGFPISCFGTYIEDSILGITEANAEVNMETKIGGGTSGYFGHIRPRGSTIKDNGLSDGSFNFARLFETSIDVISQGTSRKGMFAGYIDVEHGDIEEWLNIHDVGNPIQIMYYGVCIGKEWFQQMKDGDTKKRKLWAKILQRRQDSGIPYIFFKDNANEAAPEVYKSNNYTIWASNLCTEIMLPSNKDESFVCCLSSMNVENYDEWKDTDAVAYLTFFLDVVMSDFIKKSEGVKFLEKPHRFAKRHRALGVGVLGWHTYLQNNMIAFDSFEAMQRNAEVFSYIDRETRRASVNLAEILGEPEVLLGQGRRNTTLMAVAPTKSSSFILGAVSQGVEPIKSNYYVKDLSKIMASWRNPALTRVLRLKGEDTPEVWESILKRDGSVQHLEILSEEEKEVFKTFAEISQLAIIQQAAQRQRWIDQGQSINLMIHPLTPIKDVNKLYIIAEELGLKSLYYQNSINAAAELNRNLINCSSCES